MLDFAKIDTRTFLIKKIFRLSARLDVTKCADIKLEFQIYFSNLPSVFLPLDNFVHKVLLQPKKATFAHVFLPKSKLVLD
jgi:hypothetical protein